MSKKFTAPSQLASPRPAIAPAELFSKITMVSDPEHATARSAQPSPLKSPLVMPWGWLPADASYGVIDDPDPRVRDFFCGHMDPYRLIVNLDYSQPFDPPKQSFRSEPIDFQRGEVEIDGRNLYFNEWDWEFEVETSPPEGIGE